MFAQSEDAKKRKKKLRYRCLPGLQPGHLLLNIMAKKPRTTRFLDAAIAAAEEFASLSEHSFFDQDSGGNNEKKDQEYGNNECRKKLKRKRQHLTKEEEILQFFKKSKLLAISEKDLRCIQKLLKEGMRKFKLPQNPAVVPDNFSVPESEAGKYYAELNIDEVPRCRGISCIESRCDRIDDFEKTNHPDMFRTAIDVFVWRIRKWGGFRRKVLTKFPSKEVLTIRDKKVRKLIVLCHSELHSVRVPPGVTKICCGAFRCCDWLQKVVLPESIETIASIAFEWCILLKSINIPSGTTEIGSGAFAGNLSLRSIVVPPSVTTLGSRVFQLCMSLTHVSLPASLESIPDGAFRYCVKLTHLHLPDSVTHIGAHSFAHCVSLPKLQLPKKLQNVSDYAFQGCVKVSEFKLPYPKYGKVQFGKDVFFECHSLKTVVQLPAAKWVFVVWALGESRNRNNWRLTTLKNSKNLLILISCFAVEKHQFKVDPYVLSSPYNVPRRQVITPLVPIVIP